MRGTRAGDADRTARRGTSAPARTIPVLRCVGRHRNVRSSAGLSSRQPTHVVGVDQVGGGPAVEVVLGHAGVDQALHPLREAGGVGDAQVAARRPSAAAHRGTLMSRGGAEAAVVANRWNIHVEKAAMHDARLPVEEIDRLGQSLYDAKLRGLVEIPGNIGKQIVIDVETGDYEI